MKPGDKVYTVTNHAIAEWTFEDIVTSALGRHGNLALRSEHGHKYVENERKVYPTLRAAITARIALLEKTRKSLLTSAENHRLTIAKLKRELRKESS